MKHDWRRESEWRIVGDVDPLSMKEDVILITPTQEEAEGLRERLPYRVRSLETGAA